MCAMQQKFLVKLAVKNLAMHRLRSLLTITAMIIGISAILFLVAFAFGVEKLVTSEVTGGDAYELVDVGTGNSQIVKLNNDSMEKIAALPNVKATEYIANAAATVSDQKQTAADAAFIFTSKQYLQWLGYRLKAGEFFNDLSTLYTKKEIVINEPLLKTLGINSDKEAIGKQIELTVIVPKELRAVSESKNYELQQFTIVGVIKGPVSETFYVSNSMAGEYEIVNFSQLKTRVNPKDKVESTRKLIENLGFKTQFIGETVSQVEKVFSFFKIILGSFGAIALVVASLGMFNTLTISLLERTKEVALLKIIGMRKKDIVKIFITEAVAMGVVGGLAGIGLGYLLGKIANQILNIFATRAGGDPIVVFFFPLWFVAAVMIFAFLVSFLTGLYPARRAAKIKALDVLRYE